MLHVVLFGSQQYRNTADHWQENIQQMMPGKHHHYILYFHLLHVLSCFSCHCKWHVFKSWPSCSFGYHRFHTFFCCLYHFRFANIFFQHCWFKLFYHNSICSEYYSPGMVSSSYHYWQLHCISVSVCSGLTWIA